MKVIQVVSKTVVADCPFFYTPTNSDKKAALYINIAQISIYGSDIAYINKAHATYFTLQ